MTVSAAQITAQLDAVLAREPDALTIGIHAPSKQDWPAVITRGTRRFALRWCVSSLALRAALADAEQLAENASTHAEPPVDGLVMLTPIDPNRLPDDIAARLARGRIFQLEGWEMVRELFAAKAMDARLSPFSWMPQLLIDAATRGSYAPVAGGFLDLDTAWREILDRYLGIESARPDAISLLLWTQTPSADVNLAQLPLRARADTLAWLATSAGAPGRLALACVVAGRTADALPLGLVCDVLFSPSGEGNTTLAQSTVRLERFVGDAHVGVLEGRAWAEQARLCILQQDAAHIPSVFGLVLARADALLEELKASEYAQLSALLPRGFDQRLHTFAATLDAHAKQPTDASAQSIEVAAHIALQHQLARSQPERSERIQMARRVARWLSTPVPETTGFAELSAWQTDQGAFVDWARFRLLGGDEMHALSAAYAELRGAVQTRREQIAERFAGALAQRDASAWPPEARFVPVEEILDRVVASIARSQPVLLLVLDGASISVFRELFANCDSLGWTERMPADIAQRLAGIAAFPTTTEASRTSLLCGRLTLGAAAQEKAGFAGHAGLLATSSAGIPPKLFHKSELADDGHLARDLRNALANARQKVVGVVFNAIDDHLSGPDQLHQRWTLEGLRLLPALLREAREARRVLIVTADHGHLLEDGTRLLPGADSDRWRAGDSVQERGELLLRGNRVLSSHGNGAVVCLWSECARFAGRKNGYHGGASLAEVLVPLGVFGATSIDVPGWTAAGPAQPDWWDMAAARPPAVSAAAAYAATKEASRPSRRSPAKIDGQGTLFEPTLPLAPALAPRVEPAIHNWIDALLASAVYASQRQLAARVALPEPQMRRLLEALAERGDKLSRAALAQRMAQPEIRMGGLLSAVRRVLNVDQAEVLSVDDASGTVELNRTLLIQQFQLPDGGRSK